MTVTAPVAFVAPGESGSPVELKERYDNFIGGEWVVPTTGEYRENPTPSTGETFCEVAHSGAQDIETALDAAHAAKGAWGRCSPAERAAVLNTVADAIDENLEMLAVAESYENGKPVRETLAADIPLSADHFRYFAGAIRSEEGRISEIDENTYAYHFHEPLGVVGQIIPFNFPLLMAAWKIAPALAAGNCTVIKPASPTPWSILKLMEVIGDIIPPGVVNVVNGPGAEIGKALASNKRIAKIGFTGETVTGRLIMSYAAQNIIPSTTELGGKSPNIFFEDVLAADDAFLDKAVEGLVLYAFNKGEVCTCPSRALIQESIYDEFIERVLERIGQIKQGDPLDRETMIGAQVSTSQLEKIESYVKIGRDEGAEV
ncbi:MAG: aldehyde dehydrogenase family protein, partial [Solirubrobacterales bacterium]|nr:aldehyde dehydrogenase family protein [Solirubrobacterales bacterium]